MRFQVHQHDEVDSTNELALREVAAGRARHGDVHVARAQRAGRGRRGAEWISPPDEGLYLSAIWLPPRLLPAPPLAMACGLALFDAVRALGLAAARLKWPNDLLAGQAKLGGVLVESRSLEAARPHYVLGLGLNVRQRAFPATLEAARAVTSLALEGLERSIGQTREQVLHALAERLEQTQTDVARLGSDYLAAARLTRALVQVEQAAGALRGRVLGFDTPLRGLRVALEDEPGSETTIALEHLLAVRPLE